MSTKNHRPMTLGALLLIIVSLAVAIAQAGDDDVLNYYLTQARNAMQSRNPLSAGTVYSLATRSYYKHIGRKGEVSRVDSVDITYFFSWGHLDSQKTVSGDDSRFRDVDLTYPDVFADDYRFNLFPNDTGGPELGIGFDTDSLTDPRPVGLAVIDRHKFYPHWLYLAYPTKQNHTRYSRSMRFVEREGLIFPDSIWIVGAKAGVFSSEHYRLETGVTEISIHR